MNVSVIIPVLNEEATLPTLLNILESGQANEIIVCDGGSTDQTQQVAEGSGAVFLRCPAKGRASQMNYGAAHAHGDVFFFVHADTRPPVRFADHLLDSVTRGFEIGCYRSRFEGNDPALRLNAWLTRLPFLIFRGGDQTLFITRPLFQKLGRFDESYVVMEDYEIIRTARKHARFHIIPEYATVSARKYADNSYLRVNLANAFVFFLYILNVNPRKLWKLYTRLIRHPKVE